MTKTTQNIKCWSPLHELSKHECVFQFESEERKVWKTQQEHGLWLYLTAKTPCGSFLGRSKLGEEHSPEFLAVAMLHLLMYATLAGTHEDNTLLHPLGGLHTFLYPNLSWKLGSQVQRP